MMPLVVFLRGVNVGGHRTFRPSVLANDLRDYDVVNIGAAGTFVVRNPGPRAEFHAALRSKLPFETEIICCDSRALLRIETSNPFGSALALAGEVRFLMILSKACRVPPAMPLSLPDDADWLVRLVGAQERFVFGVYRRHMKTIRELGKVDKLFDATVTTRNWNTIDAVLRVAKGDPTAERSPRTRRSS